MVIASHDLGRSFSYRREQASVCGLYGTSDRASEFSERHPADFTQYILENAQHDRYSRVGFIVKIDS